MTLTEHDRSAVMITAGIIEYLHHREKKMPTHEEIVRTLGGIRQEVPNEVIQRVHHALTILVKNPAHGIGHQYKDVINEVLQRTAMNIRNAKPFRTQVPALRPLIIKKGDVAIARPTEEESVARTLGRITLFLQDPEAPFPQKKDILSQFRKLLMGDRTNVPDYMQRAFAAFPKKKQLHELFKKMEKKQEQRRRDAWSRILKLDQLKLEAEQRTKFTDIRSNKRPHPTEKRRNRKPL